MFNTCTFSQTGTNQPIDLPFVDESLPMKLRESEVVRCGELVWSPRHIAFWVHKPNSRVPYRTFEPGGLMLLRVLAMFIKSQGESISSMDVASEAYFTEGPLTKRLQRSIASQVSRLKYEIQDNTLGTNLCCSFEYKGLAVGSHALIAEKTLQRPSVKLQKKVYRYGDLTWSPMDLAIWAGDTLLSSNSLVNHRVLAALIEKQGVAISATMIARRQFPWSIVPRTGDEEKSRRNNTKTVICRLKRLLKKHSSNCRLHGHSDDPTIPLGSYALVLKQ